MNAVLIEVAAVVLFWGTVGFFLVRYIRIRERALRQKIADHEEQSRLRLKQRESAAWRAEYDFERDRLAAEAARRKLEEP